MMKKKTKIIEKVQDGMYMLNEYKWNIPATIHDIITSSTTI